MLYVFICLVLQSATNQAFIRSQSTSRFSRFSIWFFQPANIRVTCIPRAFILTILPD